MTKITWTVEAEDIQYEPIQLSFTENDMMLRVSRGYTYLTPDRELKPIYTSSGIQQNIPWGEVPPDVQAALAFIDNYTKDQIRMQTEHMISGSPI